MEPNSQIAVNTYNRSILRLHMSTDDLKPGQVVYRIPIFNTSFKYFWPERNNLEDDSGISTGGIYIAPEESMREDGSRLLDIFSSDHENDITNEEVSCFLF